MGYSSRCEILGSAWLSIFSHIVSFQDDELAQEIRKLKFLVLDEADRMIEAGHFAELENILRLTLRELEYVRKFSLN